MSVTCKIPQKFTDLIVRGRSGNKNKIKKRKRFHGSSRTRRDGAVASNEVKGNSCMGNNGMASFIQCKASKVTVSGQGCGTAYIPSPQCRRRRVGREEEARTKQAEGEEKERKKERASSDQPPARRAADRRERYATQRRKERIERQKKTADRWLLS